MIPIHHSGLDTASIHLPVSKHIGMDEEAGSLPLWCRDLFFIDSGKGDFAYLSMATRIGVVI
jgi:hypothetical protein